MKRSCENSEEEQPKKQKTEPVFLTEDRNASTICKMVEEHRLNEDSEWVENREFRYVKQLTTYWSEDTLGLLAQILECSKEELYFKVPPQLGVISDMHDIYVFCKGTKNHKIGFMNIFARRGPESGPYSGRTPKDADLFTGNFCRSVGFTYDKDFDDSIKRSLFWKERPGKYNAFNYARNNPEFLHLFAQMIPTDRVTDERSIIDLMKEIVNKK